MISRRHLLAAFPAIGIAAARASAEPGKLLRVGFQKGEPMLLAAKQNHSLETLLSPLGIDVQWTEFQFGPPMLEAMRVNAVDIGAVGDTPPVFAQAAHGDLLYIAAQRSGGQAILLPPGSTLQTLHDLKGKKVAFGRGSSAHSLTIAALEKGGLTYAEIQPIYLGPADAGATFERGAIDAWTIWDPVLRAVRGAPWCSGAGEVDRDHRAELLLHGQSCVCRGQCTDHGQGRRRVHTDRRMGALASTGARRIGGKGDRHAAGRGAACGRSRPIPGTTDGRRDRQKSADRCEPLPFTRSDSD